jgi:hypothetical protein
MLKIESECLTRYELKHKAPPEKSRLDWHAGPAGVGKA